MRFIKNVFSQLHSFVLWLLLSAIFWGWIFTLVTDVPSEKKVTVYCYVSEIRDTELSVALEEEKPEGIRMIKVHPFTYVMMNIDSMEDGDIFIIPESKIEEYSELLTDVDGQDGVRIYDAASGSGGAEEYIGYGGEDYYLFLGASSAHLEDGKALQVARRLLNME